jgi:hypothetical protein
MSYLFITPESSCPIFLLPLKADFVKKTNDLNGCDIIGQKIDIPRQFPDFTVLKYHPFIGQCGVSDR